MPVPMSSSVLVCEAVLSEKSELLSLIRVMDTLTLPAGASFARFFALTRIHSQPGDFLPHVLQVRIAVPDGRDGRRWRPLQNSDLFMATNLT